MEFPAFKSLNHTKPRIYMSDFFNFVNIYNFNFVSKISEDFFPINQFSGLNFWFFGVTLLLLLPFLMDILKERSLYSSKKPL